MCKEKSNGKITNMNWVEKNKNKYHKNFSVLGDDVANVVGEGELAGSGGEGDQVVVVDEVVAAEGDEYKGLVYQRLSLFGSN